MFKKISWEDKVDKEVITSPEINKITALNMNEIKTVVNDNSDFTLAEISRLEDKIGQGEAGKPSKDQWRIFSENFKELVSSIEGSSIDEENGIFKVPVDKLLFEWDQKNLGDVDNDDLEVRSEYMRIFNKYSFQFSSTTGDGTFITSLFSWNYCFPLMIQNINVGKTQLLSSKNIPEVIGDITFYRGLIYVIFNFKNIITLISDDFFNELKLLYYYKIDGSEEW